MELLAGAFLGICYHPPSPNRSWGVLDMAQCFPDLELKGLKLNLSPQKVLPCCKIPVPTVVHSLTDSIPNIQFGALSTTWKIPAGVSPAAQMDMLQPNQTKTIKRKKTVPEPQIKKSSQVRGCEILTLSSSENAPLISLAHAPQVLHSYLFPSLLLDETLQPVVESFL